jgi:hypothetical protein
MDAPRVTAKRPNNARIQTVAVTTISRVYAIHEPPSRTPLDAEDSSLTALAVQLVMGSQIAGTVVATMEVENAKVSLQCTARPTKDVNAEMEGKLALHECYYNALIGFFL